jgi:hypothetical protein
VSAKLVEVGPEGIVAEAAGYGRVVMALPTVPSSGAKGYAPGCIIVELGTGTVYRNYGTLASGSFLRLGTTDNVALDATALEINRAADVSSRIVPCTSSGLGVTEALHDGRIIVLDRAAGIGVTLPTASAGLRFRFIIKTTFTGAAYIDVNGGSDIMIGHALMGNNTDNSVVDWQAVASSSIVAIDLFGTANSTGGMAGQEIEIIGLEAGLWWVSMRGDAAGTEATPFSASPF